MDFLHTYQALFDSKFPKSWTYNSQPEFKHLRDGSIPGVQESKLHLEIIAMPSGRPVVNPGPASDPSRLPKQADSGLQHIFSITGAPGLQRVGQIPSCAEVVNRSSPWSHTQRSYQKRALLLLPCLILLACLVVFRVPWGKITAFPITLHTPLQIVTVKFSCKLTLQIGLFRVKHMP